MVSDRTTFRASMICVIFLISVLAGECEETTTPIDINQSDEDADTTTTKEKRAYLYVDNSSIPIPTNYSKYELPILYLREGDKDTPRPLYIAVALFIRRVLDVDTKGQVLTLDTDVGFGWIDAKIENYLEELNYTDPNTKMKFRDKSLDAEFLNKIWKPDIFIDEMVSSDNISLLGKLITLDFYANSFHDPETNDTIIPPGAFLLFSRRTLKLRCEMEFHYYPADTQTCRYTMRSYSHQNTHTTLGWLHIPDKRSVPPIYLNDPSDPNFDISLDSIQPSLRNANPNTSDDTVIQETFSVFRRGNYSALRFKLKIRRKLSYHVVQTYVPSILLVLITWLCFILPSSMIEARIGISMTTLLTLTAMFSSIREQSPDVSYTMAIDMWMVFCIFEVFLALLLFTSIYWLRRRVENSENSSLRKADTTDSAAAEQIDTFEQTKEAYNGLMNFTQRYGFSAFAVSFIAFFCGYWIYLLLGSGYLDFQINSEFNYVSELGENFTEAYECYNRRYFDSTDQDLLYAKCDEFTW